MKPCFSVSLVLMRLLYQNSVAATENRFYKHGTLICARCEDGWFVRVNCTSSEGTSCWPCTDCEKNGQKNVSVCRLFSDTVCGTELTTTSTPTQMTPETQLEWTVIALYITASVVLLLIFTATACKLYMNQKAPLDPENKPLKTPSVTDSLA